MKKLTKLESLQKELDVLDAKLDKLHTAHMNRWRDHGMTRARTTTHNADAGRINDSRMEVQASIRAEKLAQGVQS